MGSVTRKGRARIVDEEQHQRFERAGLTWPGPLCEVEVARQLKDEETLSEPWAKGPCSAHSVIDHIDNNRTNNPDDGSNWQRLCRAHNVQKNPPRSRPGAGSKFRAGRGLEHSPESVRARQRQRKRARGYSFGGEDPIVSTMEMAKSLECYDAYERVAKRIVRKNQGTEGVLWEELNASCCRESNTRIPTGNRHLAELTARFSTSAPFVVVKKNGEKRVFMKRTKDQVESDLTANAVVDPPAIEEER